MSTAFSSATEVKASLPERHAPAAVSDSSYRLLVTVSSPNHQPIQWDLFAGIDWDELLRQARHHSLVPLLAHRLLESRSDPVMPISIRSKLRSEFQSNLMRNFALLEEARRILQVWSEAGIDAMPYKGPVLAEQLWGSFALRECSDIDFLVPRHDVNRAGEVLSALGYGAVCPISKSLRPALLRNASEEQFKHSHNSILLELQWAPAPRTLAVCYDESQLWRRLTKISVAGSTVNAPSPEDLVGLLAIHGWKHNWSKLIWIADLAAVMRKYQLDWDQILRSATKYGWRKILRLGIEIVKRVYGVSCGADALYEPDAEILTLVDVLAKRLSSASTASYLDWHRDMLAARDSRGSQLRQLTSFLFTPGLGEYSSSRLPGWASFGYRLVRLGRVLSLWPEKTLKELG